MEALLVSLITFDLVPVLLGAGLIAAAWRWSAGPRSSRAWRGGLSILGILLIVLGVLILSFILLMALLPIPDFGDASTSPLSARFYLVSVICAAGPLCTGIALCRNTFAISRRERAGKA